MKNIIKLNYYFCPSEMEKTIEQWVEYYNEKRFHESLDNLTRSIFRTRRENQEIQRNNRSTKEFLIIKDKYQSK